MPKTLLHIYIGVLLGVIGYHDGMLAQHTDVELREAWDKTERI